MSAPWSKEWFTECTELYGKILEGTYSHWCPDCKNQPIDETTVRFWQCECFRCQCGGLLTPKVYPWGRPPSQMHEDIFFCPFSRWYNFWKHDTKNFLRRSWKPAEKSVHSAETMQKEVKRSITEKQLYDIMAACYGPAKVEPPWTYPYSFPYDEGSPWRLAEALNKFFNEGTGN